MLPSINRPAALEPGDLVGIAAPASCFDMGLYEKGLAVVQGAGFSVKAPDSVFLREGYLAGPDSARAKALMDLWLDPDVKAIFCVRGGYGSMRILDLLDWQAIAESPKIFMGFSDITALLAGFYNRGKMAVFHGPVLTSLARDAADPKAQMLAALEAMRPDRALVLQALSPLEIFPGRACGPVVGGNLSLLAHLAGTPYFPHTKGAILFIEDCAEAPYRIDRKLFHLKMAGLLDNLAGVAVGRFCQCGPEGAVEKVLQKALAPLKVPVLAGFDSGHGPVNEAFPLGIAATLDTKKATLAFECPATAAL
ncbi:MAG: LD-carboxypeptidase [Desulfatibacillaceae bacterium]|nr:LD-carboxypeptidase [Desulfatibacillaceae bacterium]